ncbi:MAG: DUF3596 domain-containing protein [Candidatus Sedimenticola sp. (ex Thyasira tokunagai)]
MKMCVEFPPGVRPRGHSIQIDFRYEGVRCRETLKLSPFQKQHVEFASNKLAAIKYEIATGTFNYAEHFPGSRRAAHFGHTVLNNITVGELVDWYYEQIKGRLTKSTRKSYENYIKNHIKPGIGNIMARKLKASQVKQWLINALSKPKSKNSWLALLKPAFRAALGDELIDRNPMEAVDSLKVRKKEPTPYSIDEVDLILDGFSSPEARGFYEIGFWTGLSPSERLGLQWDNVDFEKHCVYIRQAVVANELRDTKNEFRTRQVDLLPPAEKAFKALQQLHPNAEWVFINPKTGDLWRAETIRKRWVAALKTAGLPPGRSYVTRHTYASILLSIGVPLSWIKQQMGHTNYRMLEEVYGRWVEVPPEQRERVLNWFRQMAQNGHIPVAIKAFIKSIQ